MNSPLPPYLSPSFPPSFFQSYFMEWDIGMYHTTTDNHAEVGGEGGREGGGEVR